MKLSIGKIGNRLTPTTPEDEAKLYKLKDGYYIFSVSQIRCPIKHREFFGILNMVYENLPEKSDCESSEELLGYVKVEIVRKYWEKGIFECPAGRINDKGHVILKSISFDKMGQDEFDKFTTHAYRILANWMKMDVLDLVEWYRNR